MEIIINCSLHKLQLNKDAEKKYAIIEMRPEIKQHLILDDNRMDDKMYLEQKMKEIAQITYKEIKEILTLMKKHNDKTPIHVFIAGHSVIVEAVRFATQTHGLSTALPIFESGTRIIKDFIIPEKVLNREFRFKLEHFE